MCWQLGQYANKHFIFLVIQATSMELVNTMKDLLNMNPLYGEQFKTLMSLTGESGVGVCEARVCVWGGGAVWRGQGC